MTESIQIDNTIMEQATAWFVRLKDGPVSEADDNAFADWLATDERHGEAYVLAQDLWDETGPAARQSMGQQAALTEGPPVAAVFDFPAKRPTRRRIALPAFAAVLALVAFISVFETGLLNRVVADHATIVGERKTVLLEDGSRVILGTDTQIDVDFTSAARQIILSQGEAFFKVQQDANRPFEVVAGGGVTRALGTAFNIRRNGDQVSVALLEGVVSVRSTAGPGEAAVLNPGRLARYAEGASVVEVENADVRSLSAWTEGDLVFINRTLSDVIAEIDRYRPGYTVLLPEVADHERFTGVVDVEAPEKAFRAIETALQVDIVEITPFFTIVRSR